MSAGGRSLGDRRARAEQALRRQARRQRPVDAGRARRDLRLPRTQRQRQDDLDPHHVRAADAGLRLRHLPGLRHREAERRDQAARRLHDAALLVLGRPVDPREPRLRRAHVRDAASAARRSSARSRASASAAARRSSPARCPAAGSSASRSRPACCTSPSCCCSTSRPPASTPARAATSGRSCTPSRRAASRCWSARTTWTRPSAATSWPTSPTAG